ncbi:hypothetical protein Hte_004292 [Hypoxylon texense]
MFGLGKLAVLAVVLFDLTFVQSLPLQRKDDDSPPQGPSQYIITLRDGLDESAIEQHLQRATSLSARGESPVIELGRRWNIGSWNAYSCTMDDGALAQIGRDDAVQFIEPDGVFAPSKHIIQKHST